MPRFTSSPLSHDQTGLCVGFVKNLRTERVDNSILNYNSSITKLYQYIQGKRGTNLSSKLIGQLFVPSLVTIVTHACIRESNNKVYASFESVRNTRLSDSNVLRALDYILNKEITNAQ